MSVESVINVKCCCQDGKNHLQTSAELPLSMADDADWKLSQILKQHFMQRKENGCSVPVSGSCRAFPEDLCICVHCVSARQPGLVDV